MSPGDRFGPYEIVALLGVGGMGEVWRARDTRLGREVAIKVLPAVFAADPDRLRRFEQEARATAALSHPNILAVFDVGSHEDSPYLVEELLEGESLRSRLGSGPLPCRKAVEIATQIAHGLAAAHARGIVHRDLKPDNVFLTRDGVVKILDFGLATLARGDGDADLSAAPTATAPHAALGTAAYMAPEQARGLPVDARADLFALGAVLYEMLAGRSPFRRATLADTTNAILHEDPPPLVASVQSCPPPLDTVVRRCLEKRPEDRFSSAHDLAIALEASSWPQPVPAEVAAAGVPLRSPQPSRGRRLASLVAVAAVLVAIVLVGWRLLLPDRTAHRDAPSKRQVRIVVLPFENLGAAEDAYFASGMAEEITSRLANVRGLGVISRTTAMSYDRAGKTVTQIGAELGVDYVLEGSVRWEHGEGKESRVRITPQLIQVADDTHAWAERYDRVLADVFAIQAEVAENAVKAMGVTLLPPERTKLKEISTDDLEAYGLYLRGLDAERTGMDRQSIEGSLRMFQAAVDRDPRFAQALAGLARMQLSMYWFYYDRAPERVARAKEAAERAVELRPDLAETHNALGMYFYQGLVDYRRALEEFAAALEIQSSSSIAHAGTAYVMRRQGGWARSVEELSKALEVDPRDATLLQNFGQSCVLARRYADAHRAYTLALNLGPRQAQTRAEAAVLQVQWRGDVGKALAILDEAGGVAALLDDPGRVPPWPAQFAIVSRNLDGAMSLLDAQPRTDFENQFWYAPASLLRGQVQRLARRDEAARRSFQAAALELEQRVKADPEDARYHSSLGIAYAGLGRRDDAVREAKAGCYLMPPSRDAFRALHRLGDLAVVYTMVAKAAEAIATLDELLARSGAMTPHVLRLDPEWDPLRSDPRFQALLAKYEVSE